MIGSRTPSAAADIDPQSAREAVGWLTQLMSEDATAEDNVHWQSWLQASEQNQRAWQHIATFSSRFSLLNGSAAQRSLSHLPDCGRRRLLRSLAGLGVVGACGIGAGALPWRPWLADYRTATGEQRQIMLDDGTRLLLNTQTAVSVMPQRLTLLSGEMMVTTAPESPPPGLVLPQGELVAQGRFSVRLWDAFSDIAVYHGKVNVHSPASAQSILIRAGYGGRLGAAGYGGEHRVSAEPGWQQGMILADNMRLDDFLAEVGRYRHGIIRCDSRVAGLRLSGAFPLNDTGAIIASLPGTLPVRIASVSPYLIMIS